MLHLKCAYCGQKLKVPETSAGKTGKCPKCKGRIAVPSSPAPASAALPKTTPLDGRLFDVPQSQPTVEQDRDERMRELEARARLGLSPDSQYTGERRLAWPIDILLYPANTAGLTMLIIVVGIPVFLGLLVQFSGPFAMVIGLPAFIIDVLIRLYAVWYYAECVHDSARGGVRAPMTLDTAVDLRETWSRVLYLVAVYLLFVFPAGIYWIWVRRTDAVFWGLVAWAIVFFPMGLLAMVIHDSTSALNPLFLLGAILRTFLPYLGLLILLGMFAGLYLLLGGLPSHWLLDVLGMLLMTYLLLIVAHVLGRFYWRYRERLDWGL